MLWELGQDTFSHLSQLALAICFGLAVFRHRLWDIDPILNRTLVYGGLTTLIITLYIAIVGGLGALFHTPTSAMTGLVATAVIAVLFQPLRDHLQRGVNRLLYGERDDPAAVLTQLAQQLETADSPTAILPNLVQTIAHTLKIPHVAIWLPTAEKQFEPAAVWGAAPDHAEMLPLTYQNETIGHLVFAPRGPRESFNRHEKQLLQTIAALTANTVRAVQLSNELRQSRQRIVTGREDERRRLRRDLHDGLGPQLASQTLGLEAVGQLMSANPEKANHLLASLKTQAQEAIADIRRLIYELRPPTLDDLGLVYALQQSAARYESEKLRFTFEIPEPLPELPAAVETAVYRIAQEAMTNIVRHAQASQATIRLTCSGNHLVVEICDNGKGLSVAYQAGVGLQSMRERAAELNGRCMIESLPGGGTKVEARLPLETIDE
jgi:signal transduction histidine kinase